MEFGKAQNVSLWARDATQPKQETTCMQNGWRAEVGADRALHSARYHDDMRPFQSYHAQLLIVRSCGGEPPNGGALVL